MNTIDTEKEYRGQESSGETSQDNSIDLEDGTIPNTSSELERAASSLSEEKKSTEPEPLSPYPVAADAKHFELYDPEWTVSGHEIRESAHGFDLFLNDKFIGENIAAGESMEKSAYHSAIEKAFNTGRGVWKSEDETNLYLGIIVRNESGTYDWHAHILSREKLASALQEEKPDEEQPQEEVAAEAIEEAPLKEPGPETLVSPLQEPVRAFTLKDLRDILQSESTIQTSKTEGAEGLEEREPSVEVKITSKIQSAETSDVGISVDTGTISNGDSIQNVLSASKSLERLQAVATDSPVHSRIEQSLETPGSESAIETIAKLSTELKVRESKSLPAIEEDTALSIDTTIEKKQRIESAEETNNETAPDQHIAATDFHESGSKNDVIVSPRTNENKQDQPKVPAEVEQVAPVVESSTVHLEVVQEIEDLDTLQEFAPTETVQLQQKAESSSIVLKDSERSAQKNPEVSVFESFEETVADSPTQEQGVGQTETHASPASEFAIIETVPVQHVHTIETRSLEAPVETEPHGPQGPDTGLPDNAQSAFDHFNIHSKTENGIGIRAIHTEFPSTEIINQATQASEKTNVSELRQAIRQETGIGIIQHPSIVTPATIHEFRPRSRAGIRPQPAQSSEDTATTNTSITLAA